MMVSPLTVGMNHDFLWSDPKEDDQLIRLLKQTGVTSVRMPIRWVTVEPVKGQWDFKRADAVVDKLQKAGISILATLMSFPGWSNGTLNQKVEGWADTYPPDGVADWSRYVSQVVRHYRHYIKHWEIWNEQNGVDFWRPLPDAALYLRFLKTAYQACKVNDPNAVVLLGGLQMNGVIANPWSPVKTPNYLQALYKCGAQRWFDVVNIHPYSLPRVNEGAEYMMQMIEQTLTVMKINGDDAKPLWVTEMGCGINSVDTADAQAKLLSDSYTLLSKCPAVSAAYWFTLKDYDRAIVGPEDKMGVVSAQLSPKMAYYALRKVTAELRRKIKTPDRSR